MRGLFVLLFPLAVLITMLGCSDSKEITTEESEEA